MLEEAREAAVIPPKHPSHPVVEDAIWEGIREALLGKDVEEAARQAARTRDDYPRKR